MKNSPVPIRRAPDILKEKPMNGPVSLKSLVEHSEEMWMQMHGDASLPDNRVTGSSLSDTLLQPLVLSGRLALNNRIVMAPCTRNRSELDFAPARTAIDHYASRASAGLVITEGTLVNADARGGAGIPGIYAESHVKRWSEVTDAVHERDGKIFMQTWHMGRIAHSFYSGTTALAPSAVFDREKRRSERYYDFFNEMPVEMSEAEIARTIKDFRIAARNARRAGFDGIELHGANGYLIDQFLHQHTNRRRDRWGGTPEKRARFLMEVIGGSADSIGIERVGIRLSPAAYMGMIQHVPGDEETFEYVLSELNKLDVAYVHTGIEEDEPYDYLAGRPSAFLRRHYRGTLIGNGGYTPGSAARAIRRGAFDLVSFGRPFLANADLVERVAAGRRLRPYHPAIYNGMK
jgi:N-ethylmaleimide reductase